jgi:hypothetical protein
MVALVRAVNEEGLVRAEARRVRGAVAGGPARTKDWFAQRRRGAESPARGRPQAPEERTAPFARRREGAKNSGHDRRCAIAGRSMAGRTGDPRDRAGGFVSLRLCAHSPFRRAGRFRRSGKSGFPEEKTSVPRRGKVEDAEGCREAGAAGVAWRHSGTRREPRAGAPGRVGATSDMTHAGIAVSLETRGESISLCLTGEGVGKWFAPLLSVPRAKASASLGSGPRLRSDRTGRGATPPRSIGERLGALDAEAVGVR